MPRRITKYPMPGVLKTLMAALLVLGASGCATPTLDLPTAAALADLAPSSVLRVVFIRSNPVQVVTTDSATRELEGPAIDLARSLANRLGVPLESTAVARAEDIFASAGSGKWDVAFLAADPARASVVDFSKPYLEAQGTRQAIALPKGKRAGLAYVDQFIGQARTSGFVQRSIERAGMKGATVAPASAR